MKSATHSWLSGAVLMAVVLCAGSATPITAHAQSNNNFQFATVIDQNEPLKGAVPIRASTPATASTSPAIPFGQGYVGETEPNGTFGTASPLTGTNLVVRANLFPNGDVDFYSFTAAAGDRVYAATMTSASAGSSTDSQLTLLASDGTTVIEFDDDNGSFAGFSSSIAGARITTAGVHYLRVNDFSATASERPYELHFRLQSGTPAAETEPNDTPATANPLPASGWVSGARNPAAATEQDWFSVALNAGDTVYLGLDLDPERDGVNYNGRLGFGLFGDATNQILVVDDAGAVEATGTIPSEAFFYTVKTAGTYFAFVDSASAAVGGPTATYNLSVSVHPATNEGVNCTTYTSTDAAQAIGPGAITTSSTITVPGNPRIADVDVSVVLNHTIMNQIDAHLRSPANNDNGFFTDIGSSAVGGQNMMDATFDDEAGLTPAFTVLRNVQVKPELSYRLSWLDGENAGGTWTLDLRDDVADANGGTLTSWALRICEAPPPPTCAAGFTTTTVFSTDFETGDAGFTHSGVADEWQRGLPATVATTTANPIAPFNSCNSGVNCWKTDLINTYDISSNQDLLSPPINLVGLSPPIVVNWAQRYQMESASFDRMSVDFQQVGGATPVRLFEWLDATMTDGVGNPTVNIGESAGWGRFSRRADSLAGLNSQVRFHLDSDTTFNFGGLAVDDVSVTACRALSADLSITKTDGVTQAIPGGSVTYTITATNPAGGDPASPVTIADTFPATLTCTYTAAATGGATGFTAAGSGNINNTAVNMPAGSSVTYTASCAIAASATGTLSNTATISSGVADPTPANNTATDTDALTPQANLGITKTDGVTTVAPGGTTTYTIVASNAGVSNAPGSIVMDTFPATLTCNTTCATAGGATCTNPGAGNINSTVNLPAGSSVTYTSVCAISAGATGTIVNTATVATGAGVTDPTPGNNSATDTDTVVIAMADLAITKTDGVTQAIPGGSVTYSIVATNPAGGSPASPVTIADTFPATLTCTYTASATGGATGFTAAGSGNINDTAVNMPAGSSVTYTASCAIAASATGTISNTATISSGVTDPNPANNTATDTDTLTPQANLGITKTDGVTTVTPGGSTTYTIVASNAGPSNAPGSIVTDTFPASLTCNTTCAGAGGGTCTNPGAGNINSTVNLPTGGSVTYTAVCAISGAATGTIVNTATVATGAGVTDPTPGNNSATDTDTVAAAMANLGITKTDGLTNAALGAIGSYTIVASNPGPNPATATVNDTVPAGFTVSGFTCTGAGGGICPATGGASQVIAAPVTLPVGSSVTFIVNGTYSAIGTVSNTATVTITPPATDPTPGNNSATDTTTVGSPSNVSGTKTVAANVQPAGLFPATFTIVLTNNGTSAQLNNPGNEFDDVLPQGFTFTSASSTSGVTTYNAATRTVEFNGAIPAGGSVTITINGIVNRFDVPGGNLSNQGTIRFDADGNGTNESTALTDDPSVPGAANPTVLALGSGFVPVPALDRLGLLLMILSLGLIGAAMARNRQ